MKEVAKMLGVELGEEFRIDCARAKYRITERGLEFFSEVDDVWLLDCLTLTNLLCGEYEIVKPILTDEEKEYLSAVIKPFREMVESITKMTSYGDYIISIALENGEEINFPWFKRGKMYNGMKPERHYTLEELGL